MKIDGPGFDDFLRHFGIKPVLKITDPKADIYIGETELEPPNQVFPWGFYQTIYGIAGKSSRGKLDVAQALNFDAFHDSHKGWSNETRRQARINMTIKAARHTVKLKYAHH